jgi:transposase
MLRMEQAHVIRHKHYVERLSARQIARQLGLNRRTVRKYLSVSEPQRFETGARPQPVLGVVGPRIDALVEEWTPRLEGKHRLTAPRLYRQLREEGVEIGERTVRRYLAEKRRRAAEVYIPLVHRPGDEAQVDFFEVTVDEGGVRRRAWKFLMRLMYSGRDFIHLYDRCDRPCFLDGHVRAFAYFDGVARRLVYDNLSAAVKRILGLKERELTDRFKALVSHHLFEPCFARPGQGHDKGGVESRGKSIRLQHLTPIVAGPDLETISVAALKDVERLWRQRRHTDGRLLSELYEEDRARMLPLPAAAFDPRCMTPVAISHSSTVKVAGAVYSLPERWARLDAEAWIGANDIRFRCRGEETFRPRQRPGGKHIEYRDYLKELSRKPQAVRQVAPELTVELGAPYRELWGLLERTHGGRQAGRILAGILGAIHDHGQAVVAAALEEALAAGAFAAEGDGNLLTLTRHLPARPVLTDTVVPLALRMVQIESGSAADYDRLLAAGGAS